MDYLKEKREERNITKKKEKINKKNNVGLFVRNVIVSLIYLLLWIIIGSNVIYIVKKYDINSIPVNPKLAPYIRDDTKFTFPYNMVGSYEIPSWFSKTMITAWSSSRYLLKSTLEYSESVNNGILLLLGPIVFTLALFVVPFVGFGSTIYGSLKLGEESYDQNSVGIIITIVAALFLILGLIASGVGVIQLFMIICLILIVPFMVKEGRDNIKEVAKSYKNYISFIFGLLIISNAFQYLNTSVGVGMLITLLVLYLPSLFF
tara:strand:- start:1412 stop:2194 length:783 start_codon:yes stop_codon:yes gene_type:complete